MARATCRAISCWPLRLIPPMPATARSSSSMTNCSPAVASAWSAARSVIADKGFQFSREAFPDHDHRARAALFVIQAQDLRIGVVELADQVATVVRDEQFHPDAGPRNGLADCLQQFRDALARAGGHHHMARFALLKPLHDERVCCV